MTFFDPNHQIFRPSPIGGSFLLDDERRIVSYFHYHITLPTAVKVNAMIGRTIYFSGAEIMGTITFTIMGDGILQYWGNFRGENINQTLAFRKGKRLEDANIGLYIR